MQVKGDAPHFVKDFVYYNDIFLNERNKNIYSYYWKPLTDPRALLFICHGYGEHCSLYEDLATKMCKKGFFVFAHDQIGHGLSEGSRGFILDTRHLIEDTVSHIKRIRKDYPTLPLFMFGFSMGGSITILTSLNEEINLKGMVLVAPGVMKNPETSTFLKVTATKLLNKFFPHFPILEMDFHLVTRDEKKIEECMKDPLLYKDYWKAGPLMTLINMTEEVTRHSEKVKVPFLLLQGDGDKFCHVDGATSFYEKASSKDKTIKVYPGAYHSLFYEIDEIAKDAFDQTVEWLEKSV